MEGYITFVTIYITFLSSLCCPDVVALFTDAMFQNRNMESHDRPNVLFIVVDDLRPSLNCYGGPIMSPNIDQLAAQSARFTSAMVQQSLCGPSRTSFLTSRRPDTTKLYNTGSYWRTHAGNYTTLPQHFKENGYFAASIGKIFHPGIASNNSDDFPYSWSVEAWHPPTEKYKDAKVCKNNDGTLHHNLICPVNVTEMPLKSLPDIQSTDHALKLLQEISSSSSSNMLQPFFLAVGYHKPHVPFKYPQEFKSLYPLESIEIAPNPDLPPKLPPVAFEPYSNFREREDIAALNLSFPYGPMPRPYHYLLRQSYYAAATYTDYQVGRLLQGLEENGFANNTIIVFVGDHGWELGEHSEWAKHSNFELATRVPLMIHIPRVTEKRASERESRTKKFPLQNPMKKFKTKQRAAGFRGGYEVDEFVELVDLFPTLADLAGMEVPGVCPPNPFKIDFCSEGVSFAPVISKATGHLPMKYARWKNATFSQYPRPGDTPTYKTDDPPLKDITVMGYSMRIADYHFTEWIGFNHSTFEGDWSDVHARELYAMATDPREDNNVADEPEYAEIVQDLHQKLLRGWRDCLPVSTL